MGGRSQTVYSIQTLRAVAALAVLFPHISFDFGRFIGPPNALPGFDLGIAGVDLFFVISGFVMVYASEPLYAQPKGPAIFFSHRLIRIVPLYWLVTSFYLIISIALPSLVESYPATFVIGSYLFIPVARPDGVMEPLVGQGWTLVFEMEFYLIFALAVTVPRRPAVMMSSLVLISIVIIGRVLPSLPPSVVRWSDPILIEFIFGMLIGLAYREGMKLPKPLALTIIGVGGLLLIATQHITDEGLRSFTFGIPAALIVTGSSLGRFALASPLWRPLLLVGDASYALYLLHPIPARFFVLASRWIGISLGRFPWSFFVVSVMAAIALAIAVHYLIERPLTAFLRSRLSLADASAQRHTTRLSETEEEV